MLKPTTRLESFQFYVRHDDHFETTSDPVMKYIGQWQGLTKIHCPIQEKEMGGTDQKKCWHLNQSDPAINIETSMVETTGPKICVQQHHSNLRESPAKSLGHSNRVRGSQVFPPHLSMSNMLRGKWTKDNNQARLLSPPGNNIQAKNARLSHQQHSNYPQREADNIKEGMNTNKCKQCGTFSFIAAMENQHEIQAFV